MKWMMTRFRSKMRALIDADILRYEVGFAAEAGWKFHNGVASLPPFDYVENILLQRINILMLDMKADEYTLYITEGPTFREKIATLKPYKGTRPSNKPWHFTNLTVYLTDVLGANVITGIEADDALAVEHIKGGDTTLCSRDKDLRQVPGRFYSWELGKQPAYGPVDIDIVGNLKLSDNRKKLSGSGYAFFCAQVLMGDAVDNIPGLPGCGPSKTFNVLKAITEYEYDPEFKSVKQDCEDLFERVEHEYFLHYGNDYYDYLLEQGRLCWMSRKLYEDGSPVLWEIGMWE